MHIESYQSEVSLMKGFVFLGEKKEKQAVQFLEKGITTGDYSPERRLQVSEIFTKLNEKKKSCVQLEEIYKDAPLWPALIEGLKACGELEKTIARLDDIRKKDILQTKQKAPQKASMMELIDEANTAVQIDLSAGNRLRVLVFFATWCPHCQKEMPRLIEFHTQLQASDIKDKVDFIPIRTAIAKDNIEFPMFKKIFKIPFAVLTDNGLAYQNFAKEQGIRVSYPKIAISNTKGEIVYFLQHGTHRDTVKELFWILRSL